MDISITTELLLDAGVLFSNAFSIKETKKDAIKATKKANKKETKKSKSEKKDSKKKR